MDPTAAATVSVAAPHKKISNLLIFTSFLPTLFEVFAGKLTDSFKFTPIDHSGKVQSTAPRRTGPCAMQCRRLPLRTLGARIAPHHPVRTGARFWTTPRTVRPVNP